MFTILKGLKILGRHLKKSWWSQIIRVIILRFEEHIQLSTLECFLLFLFGIKQYLSNIYTAVYSQLSKFLSLHFFHKVTYTIFNPLSNPITFFLCSFYVSLFFFKSHVTFTGIHVDWVLAMHVLIIPCQFFVKSDIHQPDWDMPCLVDDLSVTMTYHPSFLYSSCGNLG